MAIIMQNLNVNFMGRIELDLDGRNLNIEHIEIGKQQLEDITIHLTNEQIISLLKQLTEALEE